MPIPDYYAILNVSPTAPPDSIRAAYQNMEKSAALLKHSANPYSIYWIQEAYFVLSDPARRARYDLARIETPVEPGGKLETVEELFLQPPAVFQYRQKQVSKRYHRMMYTCGLVLSFWFLKSLFTWDVNLLITMIIGLSLLLIVWQVILNFRSPQKEAETDEEEEE